MSCGASSDKTGTLTMGTPSVSALWSDGTFVSAASLLAAHGGEGNCTDPLLRALPPGHSATVAVSAGIDAVATAGSLPNLPHLSAAGVGVGDALAWPGADSQVAASQGSMVSLASLSAATAGRHVGTERGSVGGCPRSVRPPGRTVEQIAGLPHGWLLVCAALSSEHSADAARKPGPGADSALVAFVGALVDAHELRQQVCIGPLSCARCSVRGVFTCTRRLPRPMSSRSS